MFGKKRKRRPYAVMVTALIKRVNRMLVNI